MDETKVYSFGTSRKGERDRCKREDGVILFR
jgi:hypothetical protein